jgi:Bacterial antitoxin of type II TA system, VapB
MRTTINLDDDLLAEAKQVAARTGRTLAAVVEDALRESLHRRHRPGVRTVELPVFGQGGFRPGVDLDDSADLLRLMEQGDPEPGDATG